MRPIISIHIGQAGIQIGAAMWELLLLEHGLSRHGIKCENSCVEPNSEVMFFPAGGREYTAKAIFVDSDSDSLARAANRDYAQAYQKDYFVLSKSESGGLYPRGYHKVANDVLDKVLNLIHRIVEGTGYPCGFLFTHAYGGGTGSGVTARLLNILHEIYPKASQIQVAIFPSPNYKHSSPLTVEPYNVGLHFKDTIENLRAVILADNEALLNTVYNRSHVRLPNYTSVNRLLAHVLSALTAGSRFPGAEALGFADIQTNLVPTQHMRFVFPCFAPITNRSSIEYERFSSCDITSELFEPRAQLFTACRRNYPTIAATVIFRGGKSFGVAPTLASLVARKGVQFTSWAPAGFKVGIVEDTPSFVPFGGLTSVEQTASLLCNTTALVQPWEKIRKDFNIMAKKRAFIHWYTNAGMFYEDIMEATECIEELVAQYKESIPNVHKTEKGEDSLSNFSTHHFVSFGKLTKKISPNNL